MKAELFLVLKLIAAIALFVKAPSSESPVTELSIAFVLWGLAFVSEMRRQNMD